MFEFLTTNFHQLRASLAPPYRQYAHSSMPRSPPSGAADFLPTHLHVPKLNRVLNFSPREGATQWNCVCYPMKPNEGFSLRGRSRFVQSTELASKNARARDWPEYI